MIRSQIQEREQQRLLDLEKKDQETQAMLHYLERLQEEDMEQLQKKRETQHKLMEEVAKCNEVSVFGLYTAPDVILQRNICIQQ